MEKLLLDVVTISLPVYAWLIMILAYHLLLFLVMISPRRRRD